MALDSVLSYLGDEDRYTDFIADDLGMNSDYDYDSDNLECILSKNNDKQWTIQ